MNISMRTNWRKSLICCGTAVIALVSEARVLSQPAAADPPRRPQAEQEARGARPGPAEFPFIEGLTEEQRTAVREAVQSSREETRAVNEKLRQARRDLHQAIYADKLDEEAIRTKAAAVAKLEADMAVLRAKTFAKIRPSLRPEQIERLQTAPQEMAERRPRPAAGDEPRRRNRPDDAGPQGGGRRPPARPAQPGPPE